MPRKTIDKDSKKEEEEKEMDGGVSKVGNKDQRKTSSVRNAGVHKQTGRRTTNISMEVEEDPLAELMKSFGKTTISRRKPSTMDRTKRLQAAHPVAAILPGSRQSTKARLLAEQGEVMDAETGPSSSINKSEKARKLAEEYFTKSLDTSDIINLITENQRLQSLETNAMAIIYSKPPVENALVEVHTLFNDVYKMYDECIEYLEYYINSLNNPNQEGLKAPPATPGLFYQGKRTNDPFKFLYRIAKHGATYITALEQAAIKDAVLLFLISTAEVMKSRKDTLIKRYTTISTMYNEKLQRSEAGPSSSHMEMGGGKMKPLSKKPVEKKAKAPTKEKKESTTPKKTTKKN